MAEHRAPQKGAGDVVHVLLDEAYNPAPAVVGVSMTSEEFEAVNGLVMEAKRAAEDRYYLAGLPSFDEFVENGFHATADTMEIAIPFRDSLAKNFVGSTFIYTSDRSARPDLGDNALCLMLYHQCCFTILRRHSLASKVVFHFEQNNAMQKFFAGVVEKARIAAKVKSSVEVETCPKLDPPALAVADYILHAYGAVAAGEAKGADMSSPEAFQVRNYRAIQKSVSLIYSMERGRIANRSHLLLP